MHLETEVALLKKVRLSANCLFSKFVMLLMGVVIKKHSLPVKYTIIDNLSWPCRELVNDHRHSETFCCYCDLLDDAVHLVKQCRGEAFSAKLDIINAFKHILHTEEWPLVSSLWEVDQPSDIV